MNEVDIFPTFDCFGPLKDVVIIRDKQTGHHRGCAFVTYSHAVDAENAQHSLHDQFVFPGGKRPIQVKPADQSGKFVCFLTCGVQLTYTCIFVVRLHNSQPPLLPSVALSVPAFPGSLIPHTLFFLSSTFCVLSLFGYRL